MIHAVIELGERRVHEVMVPRIAIVGLDADVGLEAAVDRIIEEGHSRLPVWEGSVDHVLGILYAKDLLPFLKAASGERPSVRSLLRPPVFVPESMSIDDLLHEFQRRKVHLAIVGDEYGGTAGLVTIEDLLEEIVGEIQDEYDEEEEMVVRLDDDRVRFDGRASVDEIGDAWEDLDLDELLEDRDEYDTIGGLVFHRIGGVPRPGDVVELSGVTITVESTDGRRVAQGPGHPRASRRQRRGRRRTADPRLDRTRGRPAALRRDHAPHDLLELRPRLRLDDAGRVELGDRLVAPAPGLRPRVVLGAGPLEDRHRLGDLAGAGLRVGVDGLEARPVGRRRVLEGVDDGERLLVLGEVGRLLAGRLLLGPRCPARRRSAGRRGPGPSRTSGSG